MNLVVACNACFGWWYVQIDMLVSKENVMSKLKFMKPFTQQEPIPEQAKKKVMELLDSGRLHRYNTVGSELSDAALLEQDFAQYQGRKYCLACTSGGYGLHIALRAMGLQAGDEVLTNAMLLEVNQYWWKLITTTTSIWPT